MIEVVDQGCQTNAAVASFFVNSEGETSGERGDNIGTIFLDELAARNGLHWHTVFHYGRNDPRPAARAWHALVAAEEQRLFAEHLNPQEQAFVRKAAAFASRADFGRWRVYGEIRPGGEECTVLVTEFQAFCDNDEMWAAVLACKEKTGAHLWVMRENPYQDKHYPGRAGDRETTEPAPNRGDNAKWFVGPDHGRTERQVELSWRIDGMTPDEVTALIERLNAETEVIWPKAGVGVV